MPSDPKELLGAKVKWWGLEGRILGIFTKPAAIIELSDGSRATVSLDKLEVQE